LEANRVTPKIVVKDGRPVPVLGPAEVPVSRVVHACHNKSVADGLAEVAVDGLDRNGLDEVLTYCAETRCDASGATCPGCKKRSDADGITSLDEFIARHKEIIVGNGDVRLVGRGTETLTTPALAALEKAWSGENYWFWARRVIRKLRHGIRRAHIKGEPLAGEGETPAVILMEPQLPDNIGMVARACANFGLDELRIVNPRDGWPNEKARIAASGANYIIDDAKSYSSLNDAIGDLNWVVATTARQRDLRKPILSPESAIAELRKRIARGERCGILFGRERSGLETTEVATCDAMVMIPVNSRFASLNLAQATLLLGYVWMRGSDRASLGRVTTYETPVSEGLYLGDERPATKEELIGLFEHLESELDRLGFFNPSHKRPTVVRNVRTMLSRMAPTEQEVRTLRGIVATLAKGKGRGRKSST
jgi:tRNA/rRNA methyltransferase